MVSASVSLLTACVLGVFGISHGFPAIIQTSENHRAVRQSNSYNQESYTLDVNPVGPDDSSSDSSSSQSYSYEYDQYLNAESLIQQQQQEMQQQQQEMQQQQQEMQQQFADYANLGGSVVSTQQQQSEYEYNQQQSRLNQYVSI